MCSSEWQGRQLSLPHMPLRLLEAFPLLISCECVVYLVFARVPASRSKGARKERPWLDRQQPPGLSTVVVSMAEASGEGGCLFSRVFPLCLGKFLFFKVKATALQR